VQSWQFSVDVSAFCNWRASQTDSPNCKCPPLFQETASATPSTQYAKLRAIALTTSPSIAVPNAFRLSDATCQAESYEIAQGNIDGFDLAARATYSAGLVSESSMCGGR
jgi:hypothetical protein